MKNRTLVLAIASAIMTVATAIAQTNAPSVSAAQPQQQLVRVATLNSVQANAEFQRNVQVMQAQRQHIIELNKQLDDAKTSAEKRRIQAEIDEAMKKINEDNQKMVETYGFSLNRNYSLVVERAHIYMFVSPEEAAAIQAELSKREGK